MEKELCQDCKDNYKCINWGSKSIDHCSNKECINYDIYKQKCKKCYVYNNGNNEALKLMKFTDNENKYHHSCILR